LPKFVIFSSKKNEFTFSPELTDIGKFPVMVVLKNAKDESKMTIWSFELSISLFTYSISDSDSAKTSSFTRSN
jgi:outer membrane lipoprotein-sorting protein